MITPQIAATFTTSLGIRLHGGRIVPYYIALLRTLTGGSAEGNDLRTWEVGLQDAR
jgi:hypothetical protein